MKNLSLSNICKYSLTIFTLFLIPIYTYYYGALNFLWFSDIGLFLTVIIMWTQSNLINSMASVGILSLEIVWCIDFVGDLCRYMKLTNFDIVDGLSDYMFVDNYPLPLRLMSLFHIVLPIAWIYYLYKWGYNKKALFCFTPFYWIVISLTYLLTDPTSNTNWVFLPLTGKVPYFSQVSWLFFLYFGVPVILFLPMHFLLKKICKQAN